MKKFLKIIILLTLPFLGLSQTGNTVQYSDNVTGVSTLAFCCEHEGKNKYVYTYSSIYGSAYIAVEWSGTRWEIYTGTSETNRRLSYFSNVTTESNPPDLSIGEWQNDPDEPNTLDQFDGNGTTEAAILPVRLISFTAKSSQNSNELNWKATSEINFSHYVVETSTNGKDWKSIGRVSKNENGDLISKYSFTHHYPNTNSFYRLNMVDLDDSTEYSDIISIENNEVTKLISVYPNPAQEEINILSSESILKVEIYDSKGLLTINSQGDQRKLAVNNLSNGIYLIRVHTESGIQNHKFIKK